MSIHRKILKTGVSWQVQWRDNTGQQRSKRFHTRRDAEAFQSQIRLNKYQGLLPNNEGTKVTLGEYANRWIQKKTQSLKDTKPTVHEPLLGEMRFSDCIFYQYLVTRHSLR